MELGNLSLKKVPPDDSDNTLSIKIYISLKHLSPSDILTLKLCFIFLNNIFFLTGVRKTIEYFIVLILETQLQNDNQSRDFSCNDLFESFFFFLSSMAFNALSIF